MWRILKIELLRSFKNEWFFASAITSFVLVIWYSISVIPYCIEYNSQYFAYEIPNKFLEISYTNWLGSHNMLLQQKIFYLILPILATLPFGNSLFKDISEGYIQSILIKTKKEFYFLSKYIAVFISGGTVVVLPLLLSFGISTAFLPTMLPEPSYMFTNILPGDKWSGLFFEQPFLFVLLYLVVVFIFSGIIATFSLIISFFSYKSFLPLTFPFFVYLFFSQLCKLLELDGYSIMDLITTTGEYSTTQSVIFMGILLFSLSFLPYFLVSRKKEVVQLEK